MFRDDFQPPYDPDPESLAQFSADVFVLHERNIAFVKGLQSHARLNSDLLSSVVVAGGFALFFLLAIQVIFTPSQRTAILVVAFVLEVLALLYFWRNYWLAMRGQLLEGTITGSRGRYVGQGRGRYRNGTWEGDRDWWIDIEYEFTTPRGNLISHNKARGERNDLSGWTPTPAMRVKILYLSDGWFSVV